jgi:hypothetical protein
MPEAEENMIRVGEHETRSPLRSTNGPVSSRERWADLYSPLVAEQLRSSRRYTLVRIGSAEFAYTDFDRYLRALGQAWEAGFAPETIPTAMGRELVRVAPNLRGVDLDLTDLSLADVMPSARALG